MNSWYETRAAKRRYVCFFCRLPIRVGERHEVCTVLDGRNWFRSRAHAECGQACARLGQPEEVEEGALNEIAMELAQEGVSRSDRFYNAHVEQAALMRGLVGVGLPVGHALALVWSVFPVPHRAGERWFFGVGGPGVADEIEVTISVEGTAEGIVMAHPVDPSKGEPFDALRRRGWWTPVGEAPPVDLLRAKDRVVTRFGDGVVDDFHGSGLVIVRTGAPRHALDSLLLPDVRLA